MFRGETIKTVISQFPVDVSDIDILLIVYKQMGETVVQKGKEDCEIDIDNQTVTFSLTQQESLSLQPGKLSRSIVFTTTEGSRYETEPVIMEVKQTINDNIMKSDDETDM